MVERVISEQPITMTELKTELEKIRKRDKELNFRANKTVDYLNQFKLLDQKKVDELSKKIDDIKVPRMKEDLKTNIVNLLPRNVNDLKLILQGYSVSVTNDNIKKIVDTIQSYIPKK